MKIFFPLFLSAALFCLGCTRTPPTKNNAENSRPAPNDSVSCEKASRQLLGPSAQVLLCGSLSRPGVSEVLAVVRLHGIQETQLGIPVSKFAILRENGPIWETELIADQRPVRNSIGYIGASYIDDSYGYSRYMIKYDKQPFSLMVRFIHGTGEMEDGWPLEIDWNPAVGRFQEYSEGDTPLGFVAEIKNPRHINGKN